MHKTNPYKSPTTLTPAPIYQRFDAGKATARYLQFFAGLSVLSMIAEPLFFDGFHLDVSFIFLFWAANNLIRHGQKTRTIIILICILGLSVNLLLFVIAVAIGTESMRISVFGSQINNPVIWQVALMVSAIATILGIPLFLLLSPEAKREFKAAGTE